MSRTKRKIKIFKDAKEKICALCDNDSNVLIIHYSCESFNDIKDGKTPRITSIAVRFLQTGQTKSFSIHKIAEIKEINHSNIVQEFDILEKEMLKDFYSFLKEYKSYKWVHWNMRDINFGFEAIKHRARILHVKFFDLKDENKYDLSRLLINIYGKEYAEHPRLESVIQMNNIQPKGWLNGKTEAEAFENKEFIKLHQSTLCKVGVFEDILRFVAEGKFKSKSKWKDVYGISFQGLFELSKDNCWFNILVNLLSILLGAVIGKLFC
ncbi:hypothetical protein E0494_04575 [Marinilabiliaceae bacterium JC040]|nr:hypothetical protein [Marinilabiliaceae bacterium JC040]